MDDSKHSSHVRQNMSLTTLTPCASSTPEKKVGTTLSVDMWRVSDPDGMSNATLHYQWLADYTEIPAATGAIYTVTAADVGKKIRVRMSFTDGTGNEEVLRSRDTLTAVTGGP